MTISYEEALSTLQAMFGETWNTEALDSVLRHFEGHMENTIEAILNHGSRSPDALIAKLDPSNNNSTDFDEDLARQLAREDQPRSATTRAAGTISTARGTPTELPPEFLRIPGYSIPSTVSADEQLARMLQDEMLQRELVNNREFGHLARRETSRSNYPGPGGGTSEGPNIMDKLAGKLWDFFTSLKNILCKENDNLDTCLFLIGF